MPPPAQIPDLIIPVLAGDWAWRYYYTEELPFGRAPSRHVRRRRRDIIGAWLLPEYPRAALEVGCGPAEMSALIRKIHGPQCEVVSLDLGAEFIPLADAIARANGGELKFVLGNATRLPFKEQAFDLLVSMEMIEHVPAWPQFIAEAARVLRPGGALLISTPTRAGFHSWLKRAWQWATGWEKVNQACLRGEGVAYEKFLSRNEVAAAAARHGFVLEECRVKIFVFSFLPPVLLPLNVMAERVLEHLPGLKELGVTRFYKFRKLR